ncbi:hypothetical protein DZA50_00155 [Kangiella sp. HD9-110m-PIT-SAG07]|nr:hypothetical protein DZA50_00155 [Kangiella sp. HD9-110m-PIT-SAG07]
MHTSTKKYLSTGWGFAEATLFFILPDVLLSYFALDKKAKLLLLVLWALVGAIAGGLVMYYWGRILPEAAWQTVESVPAINTELMNKVADQLNQLGVASVILGPFQGLPYKTYAAQASNADIGIILFVIASIVARLFRFLLIAYIARGVSVLLISHTALTKKGVMIIWFGSWSSIYIFYFLHFPS